VATRGFFERPFVERFTLCYKTVVRLSVCNVGILWPNGWMDKDATGYRGKTWPRRHCVRWGLNPSEKRGTAAPTFQPMSIVAKWLDGSGYQFIRRYRPWPRRHCVRWGPSFPHGKGHSSRPPLSSPCLLWPNGCPTRQLLSCCKPMVRASTLLLRLLGYVKLSFYCWCK